MKKGLRYSIWVIIIIAGIFILGIIDNSTEIVDSITKRIIQLSLIVGGGYLGLKAFKKKKQPQPIKDSTQKG